MASQIYRFKQIQTVPGNKDLIDIVLSEVQRKTPTVVHPQFKIVRIRNFYMRKIKFVSTTFSERFAKILEDFPKIDEIHPFYGDLCNVLYDRDHYKMALGQIAGVRNLIDKISKDYVKLLKFADSAYKCKTLKRSALGRMCTIVKKLGAPLSYLEEVRQHLARLPQLNPDTRTILICGFPNVGKSSFMNICSSAHVDVQPYAFTTKSLFVGHFDFRYERWQLIDTPGVLDHTLDKRNTIEMTAITALAHIQSTILYFVDVSEMCGFTLEEQVNLFHNIKPLFGEKPLFVVLNKIDLVRVEDLSPENKALLETLQPNMQPMGDTFSPIGCDGFLQSSCHTKEGCDQVLSTACEALLKLRVDERINSRRVDTIANRIHITQPAPRADRPAYMPEGFKLRTEASAMAMDVESDPEEEEEAGMEVEDDFEVYRSRVKGLHHLKEKDGIQLSQEVWAALRAKKKLTEKDLQDIFGGAGKYSVDLRRHYLLHNEEWRYDIPPEVVDGRNVADFVDPDIEAKLEALEREEALEEALFKEEYENASALADHKKWLGLKKDQLNLHRQRKRLVVEKRLTTKKGGAPATYVMRKAGRGQDITEAEDHMRSLDLDPSSFRETNRSRSVAFAKRYGQLKSNALGTAKFSEPDTREREAQELEAVKYLTDNRSMSRDESSMSTSVQNKTADKMRSRSQNQMQQRGKFQEGESDRMIPDKMPKHLYTGKVGFSRDRR